MPRANTPQTNFTAGEISPLVRGRVDTTKYANGADIVENFHIRPQGGLCARAGTRFLTNALSSTSSCRLQEFVFSDNTAILLAIDQSGAWFFVDDEQVFDSSTVVVTGAVADANGKIKLTSVAHGLAVGEWIRVTSVGGVPNATGIWIVAEVPTANTLVLANSVFAGLYTAGGVINTDELIAPPPVVYASDELQELCFAQARDIIYVTHPNHPPTKLQRLSNTEWEWDIVDFSDGPYLPIQTTSFIDQTNPERSNRFTDVYMEVASYSHTARIIAATNFNPATVGAGGDAPGGGFHYVEYRVGDQWRVGRISAISPSGLGNNVADIVVLDNVLMFLDETTKLGSSSFKATRTYVARGHVGPGTGKPSSFTNYRAAGNFDTPSVPEAGRVQRIDPNNEVRSDQAAGATIGAGVITAQYSNTFGTTDVGKYIRIHDNGRTATGYWVQITSLAGTTGDKANHSASLPMASNQATGQYVLTSELRVSFLNAFEGSATQVKNMFTVGDVGRMVRVGFGGRWAWGIILTSTGGVSGNSVGMEWFVDMPRDPHNAALLAGNRLTTAPDSGVTYDWRLGAWSSLGTADSKYPDVRGAGWPAVCCFHEQRLFFARTDGELQTLWGSVSADFENMQPTELDSTVLDDNAVTFTLASARANPIKWLQSGTYLYAGTIGNEWALKAAGAEIAPLTPTNIIALEGPTGGSLDGARPIKVGTGVLFLNRAGRKLMELQYDLINERIQTKDLTIVSEHILHSNQNGFQLAWQQEPYGRLWVLCNSGVLACMTYEPSQEVVAWHRHVIAGVDDVLSIAVLPSFDGTEDRVYIATRRTQVDSPNSTFTCVERLNLEEFFTTTADVSDQKFLDGSLTVDGPTDLIQGMPHLIGKNVTVFADGVDRGTFEVLNSGAGDGVVDIGTTYTKVQIGLPFFATYKGLPPDSGSAFGSSTARTKRVSALGLRLHKTYAFYYGWINSYQDVQRKIVSTAAVPFFTGTEEVRPNTSYDLEAGIYIQRKDPTALNVLAIVNVLETND